MARVNTYRPQGSLPRNIEANLRELLKAISLHNGKTVKVRVAQGPSANMKRVTIQESLSALEESIEENDQRSEEEPKGQSQTQPIVQEYKPQVLYPSRLIVDKEDAQFKKFINISKQLHVNIPIVEALSQMLKYAKFLKDLLTNKRKL